MRLQLLILMFAGLFSANAHSMSLVCFFETNQGASVSVRSSDISFSGSGTIYISSPLGEQAVSVKSVDTRQDVNSFDLVHLIRFEGADVIGALYFAESANTASWFRMKKGTQAVAADTSGACRWGM